MSKQVILKNVSWLTENEFQHPSDCMYVHIYIYYILYIYNIYILYIYIHDKIET